MLGHFKFLSKVERSDIYLQLGKGSRDQAHEQISYIRESAGIDSILAPMFDSALFYISSLSWVFDKMTMHKL